LQLNNPTRSRHFLVQHRQGLASPAKNSLAFWKTDFPGFYGSYGFVIPVKKKWFNPWINSATIIFNLQF
jgi:hypothetical protein